MQHRAVALQEDNCSPSLVLPLKQDKQYLQGLHHTSKYNRSSSTNQSFILHLLQHSMNQFTVTWSDLDLHRYGTSTDTRTQFVRHSTLQDTILHRLYTVASVVACICV